MAKGNQENIEVIVGDITFPAGFMEELEQRAYKLIYSVRPKGKERKELVSGFASTRVRVGVQTCENRKRSSDDRSDSSYILVDVADIDEEFMKSGMKSGMIGNEKVMRVGCCDKTAIMNAVRELNLFVEQYIPAGSGLVTALLFLPEVQAQRGLFRFKDVRGSISAWNDPGNW